MKEMIQQLALPIILGMIACQGLWELIIYKIKRKDNKNDSNDKVFAELEKINNRLDKIDIRLGNVESELKLNTEATKGTLYTELDKWINKMEIIGCWSSESKEKFEHLLAIYKNMGNGIDNGIGLQNRADSIPVDNTQFHEKLSRYNKHKIAVMNGGIE